MGGNLTTSWRRDLGASRDVSYNFDQNRGARNRSGSLSQLFCLPGRGKTSSEPMKFIRLHRLFDFIGYFHRFFHVVGFVFDI